MGESTKQEYFQKLLDALKGSGLQMVQVFESKTYAHFSDGKNIIYIQVNDMPWEYSVSAAYIPSRDFGTGCRLGEIDFDTEHEEILRKVNALLVSSLPSWLGDNGRWPERYKNLDQFIERQKAMNCRPVVVKL